MKIRRFLLQNRTIKEGNHMELKVGDKAPDFKLSSTRKEKISLSDYEGKKNVLLAFYPLNFTPG
jgi:peroxiredoxin